MEYRKVDFNHFVIRIDKGEEIISKIKEFCEIENVRCGSILGLGAANYVKVGLFDTEYKKYNSKEFSGPMEITSLVGNISTQDGKIYLHCHINLCDSSMNVFGGHLNECVIGATCEIIITVIDGVVERKFDDVIGLNLFKFLS